MGYLADFYDAHLRHWQDAELLFQSKRWANADQLYGFSAECGLKAIMRGMKMMPVTPRGVPTRPEHRVHGTKLWSEFTTSVRSHKGAKYLSLLPDGDPFANWSITDRYAHGQHFNCAGVSQHRSAADGICKMVESARLDGVV